MSRLVGIIRPFESKQTFHVYGKDNQIIYSTALKTESITEDIMSVVQEYSIKQITLTGPKQYNRGFAKKIQEAEMLKYNKNELDIQIV